MAISDNTQVNILKLKFDSTKKWCTNNAFEGVTLVRCGDFYETFAGDARRFIMTCETPRCVKDGLLMTGVPAHAIQLYLDHCAAYGLAVQVIE